MAASVSVVVPCYRQANFLADALDSLRAQEYQPCEVVVVDDGSPDDVAGVVRRHPAVRLLQQENRGLSRARNRGLEETSGEYVVFLDADDRLLPCALARGAAALDADPARAMVWGYMSCIDAEGRATPAEPPRFRGTPGYEELLRRNIVGPPLAAMFRRSALRRVGGFSVRQLYSEDYELYLRVARQHPIWCHGHLIGEYRLHNGNMSRNARGMLAGNLMALGDQAPWMAGQPALRSARRTGLRITRETYDGGLRIQELSGHLRARRWFGAARTALPFFLRYPRLFLTAVRRRVTGEPWAPH